MSLLSIYELKSLERGGKIARAGFNYQDHVGVAYIIKLLKSTEIKEIWFEGEDDIVLLWEKNGAEKVEMIQVKSNDLTSRWSISKLLEEAIIEKSIHRGRCSEDVIYRIVTSYDVDRELEILKFKLGSTDRNPILLSELSQKIAAKRNISPNLKGHTVHDWINNCVWEKLPDSVNALESQNKLELEAYLVATRNRVLPPDARDELYQKMLRLVYQSSLDEEKYNFPRHELESWLDDQLFKVFAPKGGHEKMVEKMARADLDSTTIEAAKEMKYDYIFETLNNEYVGQKTINKFKGEALSILMTEKLKYDNGELELTPAQFHKHCLNKMEILGSRYDLSSSIVNGCMYDITNRCLHRFLKIAV